MIFNSLESVKNVLEDVTIGPSSKLVYVVVAVNGGTFSAGQRLISERYGIDRKTLRTAVQALQSKGYLDVAEGKEGRGSYTCAEVSPKPRTGRRAVVKTEKPFDLVGIIRCNCCQEWIDVEQCERVDTVAMQDRLTEDLEPAGADTESVGDWDGFTEGVPFEFGQEVSA